MKVVYSHHSVDACRDHFCQRRTQCCLDSPVTWNSPSRSSLFHFWVARPVYFFFFFLNWSQNESPAALIHWGWFIPEGQTRWIKTLVMPNSSLIKGKACLTLSLFYGQNIPESFKQASWGMIVCVCVCVCVSTIIIINSTCIGSGSVLRAHINPYSNLLNWLLGLSHFTDEEKWDKDLNPECTHLLCSYLSVSAIPFQKTEAIYNFLWEIHVSKFVPHEHVLVTWNVLSWLSLSTPSKHYQPCLSCWEIDSKWLKNNNSVEREKKKKDLNQALLGQNRGGSILLRFALGSNCLWWKNKEPLPTSHSQAPHD